MAVVTQQRATVPPPVFNGDDGGDRDDGGRPVPSAQLGLWLFLIAVTMLFMGFASAYIISSRGKDWQPIPMPNMLWVSTALLLLSSGALELARRSLKTARVGLLYRWLWVAALLGGAFLVSQLEAWRSLRRAGLYLPTHPHSSFFYLMTGAHGLHVLGGLVVLAYVIFQAARGVYTRRLHRSVGLCAVYWHFLGGLWLYLFWLFLGT